MTIEALVTRLSPLTPSGSSTFDPTTRTMRAVIAAGAEVERWDSRGAYIEVLDHGGMVLPAGASTVPVLNAHNRGDLAAVLGVASDFAAKGSTIEATLKLSARDEVAHIAADIAAGIITATSVGYRVLERAEKTDAAGRRVVTATRWELAEVSIVPIPADPRATIRSEAHMPEQTPAPTVAITPTAPVATRAAINGEIRALATSLGLPQSWTDQQVDGEATVEAARAAALDAVIARSASTPPISTARAHIVHDHSAPDDVRAAMADALAHRLAPSRVKLEGRATEFRSWSVLDMVAETAAARGERLGNTRDRGALAERALTTSDFPGLLADAGNKALLATYAAAAPTYRKWAAPKTFNDLRPHSFLRIGDFPKFVETAETGELTYGSIGENREKVSAKEYNAGIVISRRALLHDDLSALADFSNMIAVRAAADENALAYSVLNTNGNLVDGAPLFAVARGNIFDEADITALSLGGAVRKLREQKSADGIPLNLSPRYLVVGPDREMQGRQVLATISPTSADSVNPWAGSMELVVDANVDDTWFVIADPASAPTVVFGYLSGSEGPQLRTEIDFDTRNLKVAAGLDFGVGPIDFRGAVLVKNI
ncbi:prohead protease/major capsid protein fusion protein [Xanthobacter versatilis]|uniref:prohead protease/major capsid protein fusion protein n=1 Tax=Xanthobacter autotrophicus (strain ATCC BAA-1158 / Py2) TaxID=78245 RepID=UPI00372BB3BC